MRLMQQSNGNNAGMARGGERDRKPSSPTVPRIWCGAIVLTNLINACGPYPDALVNADSTT